MILTPKQQRVIEELARYKYLTVSQFLRLGVDKHRSNLSTAFKRLTEGKRPLVKVLKFGLIPKKGRVEALYYLTSWGAKLVEDAKYPKSRTVTLTSDYFHRVATINCEVELHNCTAVDAVVFSHRYFDHVGSNRKSNRKVLTTLPVENGKQILADWIFKIQTEVQQELYCAEVYMDEHDTARPFNSLHAYLQALTEGSPNQAFDFDRGVRVLGIFGTVKVMDIVLRKIALDSDFSEMEEYFLFKSLDSLQTCNFDEGWINYTGEVKSMW